MAVRHIDSVVRRGGFALQTVDVLKLGVGPSCLFVGGARRRTVNRSVDTSGPIEMRTRRTDVSDIYRVSLTEQLLNGKRPLLDVSGFKVLVKRCGPLTWLHYRISGRNKAGCLKASRKRIGCSGTGIEVIDAQEWLHELDGALERLVRKPT